MKKAFLSATLMGLLIATGFVAFAQEQEQPRQQQRQEQQQPAQRQSSADDVFGRLDTDRDGKLSEAEFRRAQVGASEQDAKAQFEAIDANGDNSISKQEFAAKYNPSGE